MNIPRRWVSRMISGTTAALGILMLGMTASMADAPKRQRLPSVTSARVPFYPEILQKAHFEGVVRLRIESDGSRASSIVVVDGQPMLAQAATENLKTWEFEQHSL